jgi:glycosyltransferase involved in cell wall biosynthesis
LLISAFDKVRKNNHNIRLIIAGHIQTSESANYWDVIKNMIEEYGLSKYIIKKIEYIPDDDIEVYFKSADVCILPYRYIFQTGILFIAYRFGLPVIATDVGSFREDIVEGKTGFICNPNDPEDLKNKILMYYNSDMYINKSVNEIYIKEYAFKKYSWNVVSEETSKVYYKLLGV